MHFKIFHCMISLFCLLVFIRSLRANGKPIVIKQINAYLLNQLVDINLKIVAADAILPVRTQDGRVENVWTLVGMDGTDFIGIKVLGNLAVQRLQSQLGPAELVGQAFAFHQLKMTHGRALHHGGLPFKLELVEESAVQANVQLNNMSSWADEHWEESKIVSRAAEKRESSQTNLLRAIDANAEQDDLVDVNLKLLAMDAIFFARGGRSKSHQREYKGRRKTVAVDGRQRAISVIGSDGTDFVNVRVWGEWDVREVLEQLGNSFLGKSFALSKFRVSFFNSANNHNNYGSVSFGLNLCEQSGIQLIDEPSTGRVLKGVTLDSYYQRLLADKTISAGTFKPTPSPVQLSHGGKIDLLAKMIRISPLKVVDELRNSRTLIIDLLSLDSYQHFRLTVWNILAEFLSKILHGKEGANVRFKNLTFDTNPVGHDPEVIDLCFVNDSRIAFPRPTMAQGSPPLHISSTTLSTEVNSSMSKSATISSSSKKGTYGKAGIGELTITNPLRRIKNGDNYIDLFYLNIVAAEEFRTVKAADGLLRPAWTLVGSDGSDFVNIVAWGENSVNYLKEVIGTKNIGRTFALENFHVLRIPEEFNYGSVEFELKMIRNSGIYPDELRQGVESVNVDAFFKSLRDKKTVSPGFTPTRSLQVQREGTKINLIGKLIEIRGPTVQDVALNSRVVNIKMKVGKRFVSVAAWDILADFLVNILQEKEGTEVRLEGVEFRTSKQAGPTIDLRFGKDSRISVPSSRAEEHMDHYQPSSAEPTSGQQQQNSSQVQPAQGTRSRTTTTTTILSATASPFHPKSRALTATAPDFVPTTSRTTTTIASQQQQPYHQHYYHPYQPPYNQQILNQQHPLEHIPPMQLQQPNPSYYGAYRGQWGGNQGGGGE